MSLDRAAIERALRRATEPHIVTAKTTGWRLGSLSGWDGGRDMPHSVREAVESAHPMPSTVAGIWAEHQMWDELHRNRDAFEPYYDSPIWDWAREHVLEIALDTLPAAGLDDVMARMDWMEHLHRRGFDRDVHDDLTWLATLRADVTRLAEGRPDCGHPAPVQSEHTSAKTRRAHVMSILDNEAALSDREIARRAGVSPTTVGKLRRRASM